LYKSINFSLSLLLGLINAYSFANIFFRKLQLVAQVILALIVATEKFFPHCHLGDVQLHLYIFFLVKFVGKQLGLWLLEERDQSLLVDRKLLS